jgi:hypothetical protein
LLDHGLVGNEGRWAVGVGAQLAVVEPICGLEPHPEGGAREIGHGDLARPQVGELLKGRIRVRDERLRTALKERRNGDSIDVVGAHVERGECRAHRRIDAAGGDQLRHVQARCAGKELHVEPNGLVEAVGLGLKEPTMLRLG